MKHRFRFVRNAFKPAGAVERASFQRWICNAVSLELGKSTWLITSLSPGGGERMSKYCGARRRYRRTVGAPRPASGQGAQARTGQRFAPSSSRRRVSTASGSIASWRPRGSKRCRRHSTPKGYSGASSRAKGSFPLCKRTRRRFALPNLTPEPQLIHSPAPNSLLLLRIPRLRTSGRRLLRQVSRQPGQALSKPCWRHT
jgi:hypothetical protein